jgi:uncharacterized delta-60 repeat protein
MPAHTSAFRPRCERLEPREVPSFGTGGFVTTDIAGADIERGRALAVQGDGKIVAAGLSGVVRYNADGSLDTTFNAAGPQPGVILTHGNLFDLAILPDGRILVAGDAEVKGNQVGLLQRFTADGAPDPTFGTNGVATHNFGRATKRDSLRSIALQADGKIVGVGNINVLEQNWGWGVARFNPNGSVDKSFDKDGWLTTTVVANERAYVAAVAVQSDGRIVAAGDVLMGAPTYSDAAVVRYLPSGALDTSFGGTGKVTVDFSPEFGGDTQSSDDVSDVALQADGRVVFVGQCYDAGPSTVGLIGRLNPDGTLDNTFGGDGRVAVIAPLGVNATGDPYIPPIAFNAVAIQGDGRIVAWSVSSSNIWSPGAVVRVNQDGSLDTTFSGDGIAFVHWPEDSQHNLEYGGLAIQPDGKIVVCGGHWSNTTNQSYFDLARLNEDGTLDI